MGKEITGLVPSELWRHFYALTQIPRPSKHEDAALDYCASVGKSLGIEVVRDSVGNVILRAPASLGYEHLAPVILQGHADMVPQKNHNVKHDFLVDAIQTHVADGWVRAEGTTLGADNGIGVSAALAVLSDASVKHGPIEVLVTREEETSMYGANALRPGLLHGRFLLNLDSEQEGVFSVGCAGGVDVEATFKGALVATADEDIAFDVRISGLKGGHSGMDINLGRANANKLLVRFLKFAAANYESMLSEISGGDMRNAIPREAHAVLTIDSEDKEDFIEAVEEFEDMFRAEYSTTEPNLRFYAEPVPTPSHVIDEMTADDLINALQACPNGVSRMSADVPGLVQTSANLAIVQSQGERIVVKLLLRSSVDTEKDDLVSSFESIFRLAARVCFRH